MLKLYYAPGACSRASHIALEEAGAPFERKRVDLAGGEQGGEAYRKINPKGRVPVLETDRGLLTETPAILAYIAQTNPKAKLAPLDDPFDFARMQEFNSYLCSTVHVNHAHRGRGTRWADDPAALEAMKKKVPETMAACMQLIEDKMLKGPYVLGGQYSVADAYLYTLSLWLPGDSVDIKNYPKLEAHQRLIADRPATQRALAAER